MDLKQRNALIIASLLIAGSLVLIWRTFRSPPPLQFDRAPVVGMFTGAGERLAEETVQAVHGQGRIVLVTNFDPQRGSRNRGDYCWDAFQRKLREHAAISVVATEVVPYDPAQNGPGTDCPRATLYTILKRHAQTDAIVFFIALPRWPGESVIPRPLAAKLIVVDRQGMAGRIGETMRQHYAGYFTSGVLSVLMFPRPASELAAASPANPQTPREWFEKYYQVYTPANADALPD